MYRARLIALALTAGTATAVLTLGGHAAGAADAECTAWASMPSTVAITSQQTVVHATLTGDSGCTAQTFENGATATLFGPRGAEPYYQQWPHFGTSEQIDVVVGVTRAGTYTMTDGDVQLYDAQSLRIPSRWASTSMTVKNGGSVKVTHHSRTAISGRAGHYSTYGWVGSNGVPVAVQKRTASGWHTVTTVRADGYGRFTARGHFPSGSYRVVASETTDYWGASATVR